MGPEWRRIEATNQAGMTGHLSLRLIAMGFRLIEVQREGDGFYYILPPVTAIPAGPFLMGSDPDYDAEALAREQPQHHIFLPPFTLATYPLTVAEFRCFLQARAYTLARTGSRYPWQHQQDLLDYPMVGMTWADGNAYATWLSECTNHEWRLPTEAEWEKAARGTDGRMYPWGNQWDRQRANSRALTGRQARLMPINSFPLGESPYGCCDMAGNVFEWTSSEYRAYPYDPDAERQQPTPHSIHVRRGGAWGSHPSVLRTAYRVGDTLENLADFTGVRLVCVSDQTE